MNYKVWIGTKEQSDEYMGEKLTKLCDKGFSIHNINDDCLKRVTAIDVIWYKEGVIKFIFEVENTTSITEAFVRGSNIPYSVRRFIVIPEEREKLLNRKFSEPMIKDYIEKYSWGTLFYTNLIDYYDTVDRKKTISPAGFEDIIHKKAKILEDGQRTLF
jgi:hypothetical protein